MPSVPNDNPRWPSFSTAARGTATQVGLPQRCCCKVTREWSHRERRTARRAFPCQDRQSDGRSTPQVAQEKRASAQQKKGRKRIAAKLKCCCRSRARRAMKLRPSGRATEKGELDCGPRKPRL